MRSSPPVDQPKLAPLPAQQPPAQPGLVTRATRRIGIIASYCWQGVKYVARPLEKPVVLALSAVGAAAAFYGTGNIIVQYVGPGLALLAAPISGAVIVLAVKFRPANARAAAAFKQLNKIFDHLKNVFSRAGLHYLYLNRLGKLIAGERLNTVGVVVIPLTAFSTAMLAHILNEYLKSQKNPNVLLIFVSGVSVNALDYGAAVSGLGYVLGDANAGVISDTNITYFELALTGVGILNETIIRCASENARYKIESGFEVIRSTSRTAFILSTIESMDALANNDNVSLTQLSTTSALLGAFVLSSDIGFTLRDRIFQYRHRQADEHRPLLLNDDAIERPLTIESVTWSMPDCCHRRPNTSQLFTPRVEDVTEQLEQQEKQQAVPPSEFKAN